MPRGMIRCLVGVVAALQPFVSVVAAAPHQSDAGPAFLGFQKRIVSYAELHARLAAGLAAPKDPGTPRAIAGRRGRLSSAIKAARPNARQGDVFTPDAVQGFRRLLTVALEGQDANALLRDLFDEHPGTVGLRLRVHDQYPDWATHEMSALLLQYLPSLPDGIEYRLVDHDLVILDTQANLIVDVLPEAIPPSRP
jgi:hypothetical protein